MEKRVNGIPTENRFFCKNFPSGTGRGRRRTYILFRAARPPETLYFSTSAGSPGTDGFARVGSLTEESADAVHDAGNMISTRLIFP